MTQGVPSHNIVLNAGAICTADLQNLFISITKASSPLKQGLLHMLAFADDPISESVMMLRACLLRKKFRRAHFLVPMHP